MSLSTPVQTALAQHINLPARYSPKTLNDSERMVSIPYSSAVGSLMYVMVCTRPDISYGVSIVSRYLANPGYSHWLAVKWILRYLKGTSEVGLRYSVNSESVTSDIAGYDYAKDKDRGRSLTSYAFRLFGCTVRRATLQRVVALSTAEAEYMALTGAVKEAIWLRGIVGELGIEDPTAVVNCDNQCAIQLTKNPLYHERTKHINVRFHFIKDVVEDGDVVVEKVDTSENAADMMTKALPAEKFNLCVRMLSVEAVGCG